MKSILVLSVFIIGCLVAVQAGKDYFWGEIGPQDVMIEKKLISRRAIWFFRVTEKYVFMQDNPNAYTITAIKITDKLNKYGATAKLLSGGLGSKGATIEFTSERSIGIKDEVEIWGH